MSKGERVLRYLLTAAVAYAGGMLFSLHGGEILAGYTLPVFAPPHWVWPLSWPVMFLFIVFGLAALEPGSEASQRAKRCYFLWVGLFLFWPIFFFRLGLLFVSAVVGLLSWGMLLRCRGHIAEQHPKQARLLLLPVAWTAYGVTVNLAIAMLNR